MRKGPGWREEHREHSCKGSLDSKEVAGCSAGSLREGGGIRVEGSL